VLLQKAALPQSLIQKHDPEEFRNVFLFNSSLYERVLRIVKGKNISLKSLQIKNKMQTLRSCFAVGLWTGSI